MVPTTALVDLGGRRGVFTPLDREPAVFRAVQVGIETGDIAEILGGLDGRRSRDHHRRRGAARRRPHRAARRRRRGGRGGRGNGAARWRVRRTGATGDAGGTEAARAAQRHDRAARSVGGGAERRRRPATGRGPAPRQFRRGGRRRAARRRRTSAATRAGQRRSAPTSSTSGICSRRRTEHRHEHSSFSDSTARHDVHAQRGHHAARRCISLTRLPVDLMPEFAAADADGARQLHRRRSARDGGAGHAPDRAGGQRRRRSRRASIRRRRKATARCSLNFDWGTRPRAKPPTKCARASIASAAACRKTPTRRRSSSSTRTRCRSCSIGVEGDYDPVTLRELAENDMSPRFERVDGVAAVTVNGGLRRQIHVDLSKEKITALNLSVDRGRRRRSAPENQNTPLGEINQGDSHVPASAARASSRASRTSATSSCMTREGVPVYMRDIADVQDAPSSAAQFMRINGKPRRAAAGAASSRAPTPSRSPTA